MLYSIRAGRYIHDIFNAVGTASGSWTQLNISEAEVGGCPTTVRAVYWDNPTAGAFLVLKDATDKIFYTYYHSSGSLNYLTYPLTINPPVQYFDSEGGNTLSLYGNFS